MELSEIEEIGVELLRRAVTRLPEDVKESLKRALSEEESEIGRTQLEAILKNVEMAEKSGKPMCQDTGVPLFFLRVGKEFPVGIEEIKSALVNSVRRGTKEIPLRPNVVDPMSRENTGDNSGRKMPYFDVEIVDGDSLEITFMPKGAGSENMSFLGMLSPSKGVNGIKEFVLEKVIEAGGKPCPPTIIGIGIGGTADLAMKLAKRSLLRPLNEDHNDERIRELEREIAEMVNSTGIGPMGLGGKFTCLGVRMDFASTHTATLPVAINFQCWAARRSYALIEKDGVRRVLP
ncbi:fumarate hydratase [Candidatus Bathyarchaeota archaeon ex4484_205]|nr:MAG: fumarate hydratase [Candidatus Bathyarchaeota archaeon ex4484_205]RLF91376.1 MAG: fumarate hydratase [Thermococci archaeon]RLF96722.1 MAG: fumarate hydratase [Thermococci archaeon]